MIHATGGGAHKYSKIIVEELNINIDKHDELLSLVNGYILMNDYQTFYEYADGQIRYVDASDMVVLV